MSWMASEGLCLTDSVCVFVRVFSFPTIEFSLVVAKLKEQLIIACTSYFIKLSYIFGVFACGPFS